MIVWILWFDMDFGKELFGVFYKKEDAEKYRDKMREVPRFKHLEDYEITQHLIRG